MRQGCGPGGKAGLLLPGSVMAPGCWRRYWRGRVLLPSALLLLPFVAPPQAVVGAQAPSSGSPHVSDEEPVLPSVSFSDALTLTVKEGHPVQLTARELADMTPAELAKYYKVGAGRGI